MRTRAALLSMTVLTGCYADKAAPGGPPSSMGMNLPDGGGADAPLAPTDGPTSDAAAADASGDASRTSDAPVDAGAAKADPTRSVAYHQLLDQQWAIWSERWVKCFNTPLVALPRENAAVADLFLAEHDLALSLGLVTLDPTRAAACLEALRTSSCEALATRSYEAVCRAVLVGQVATGGFCVSPEDCKNPGEDCLQQVQSGCLSRCLTRAPTAGLEQPCDQLACPANASCHIVPGQMEPPRCHLLYPEGGACPSDQTCVSGTWCQLATADVPAGTCRKVAGGGACQGTWQCPHPYACLFATPGAPTGTCGPGKGLGEPCALHSLQSTTGPYHDCANGLHCYPEGGSYKCGLGRTLGQSCAEVPSGGTNPLSVPCREGACRLVGMAPTCVADGKLGATCSPDLPCEPGLMCDEGRCRDPRVGLGQRCDPSGTLVCLPGARCAMTAGSTTDFTCVALKEVGERCDHPDACVAAAECAGGVCTACK